MDLDMLNLKILNLEIWILICNKISSGAAVRKAEELGWKPTKGRGSLSDKSDFGRDQIAKDVIRQLYVWANPEAEGR